MDNNNNTQETTEVSFDDLLDSFLNTNISDTQDTTSNKNNAPLTGESYDFSGMSEINIDNNEQVKEDQSISEETSVKSFLIDQPLDELGSGEKELMKAYLNFIETVYTISNSYNVTTPELKLRSSMLVPNYRPTIGQILSKDVLDGWDILLTTNFEELKDLDMSGSDDDFLNYAEKLSNANLQFAIVSYIETLIELEACELSYQEKKLRFQKRKIEQEFFEEQRRKNERKQKFIDAVRAKNFPIDAERLINNYLKTANKDAEGAFEALVENPAIYAPIQMDKIKPRLFGLIKKSAKDGIRMNKKIGKFMKNLKA